ncbi:MAG: glycosyltransferase [Steroidobacteraceae bacterium]
MLVPSFTVVIPVTHSLEELRACLDSLGRLNYPRERFQVGLVDCHVVGGVQEFCRNYLPEIDLRASLLVLPETDHKHPRWMIEARANEARNHAMQELPGDCFAFTEDDCTLESDWLDRIAAVLDRETGAVGGPELLPKGLGWLAEALDVVLNSRLGSGGMRRGDRDWSREYYPRKQNMAFPAQVIARTGGFPGDKPVGGELEMAIRVRQLGLRIVYLPDNPVWHRRITTFSSFVRLSASIARENVRVLRRKRLFHRSLYLAVLGAAFAAILLVVSAPFSAAALAATLVLGAIYFSMLLAAAVRAGIRTGSASTGLGVLLLVPAHHLSLMVGTARGALAHAARDGSG